MPEKKFIFIDINNQIYNMNQIYFSLCFLIASKYL